MNFPGEMITRDAFRGAVTLTCRAANEHAAVFFLLPFRLHNIVRMSNDQVTFEFTLDELVSFQMGLIRSTGEGASWRRREQWKFAASLTLVSSTIVVLASSYRSLSVVIFGIVVSAVIAAVLTPFFGQYYDHVIRTRMRRLLTEQAGTSGPYTCSMELRQEGLSVKQMNVEMNFSWRDATSVNETPDGVLITFRRGRALARNRGFISPGHRSVFLTRARELRIANN